jgi:hypothetical protein
MGQKLSEPDMTLYRRTDEILHFVWDPIGIAGHVGARDEYYMYLPAVFALVKQGASAAEIEQHLNQVALDRMGITDAASSAARAAELLVDWRTSIEESNPPFQRTASPPLN